MKTSPEYPARSTAFSRVRRTHARSGVMLVECIVYIAVLFVILNVAVATLFRVLDHTRGVQRVSADVARALDAGERWRTEIRAADGPLRLVNAGDFQALHIPRESGEVVYVYDGTNVLRHGIAVRSKGPFLVRVSNSRFVLDQRAGVRSWRWEVELESRRLQPKLKPLFTFQAVPPAAKQLP